jgi:hypothetical protein
MNTRISFMHLEIASYSVGALFRQVFLISAQWTSERDIAHMDAPLIVLNVPIYRAGLSRLGRRGRAAAAGAYDQFLKSLFR